MLTMNFDKARMHIVACSLPLVLASCGDRGRSESQVAPSSPPVPRVEQPTGARDDVQLGSSVARDGRSQRLAVTDAEAKQLQAHTKQYFGVSMARSGAFSEVPTAEEWAAAFRMSDEELRAAAAKGDLKAKFLWGDRLLSNAIRDRSARSAEPPAELSIVIGELSLRSASPQAAYLFGRQMYELGTTRNPAYVAAALEYGNRRGDPRAEDALRVFRQNNPDIDEGLVTQVLDSLERPHRPS